MLSLVRVGNYHFMPSDSLPMSVHPDADKPMMKRAFLFSGANMKEEWRAVAGYEEQYEVSNLGRVRSLLTGKIKALGISTNGYKMVSLSKNATAKYKRYKRVHVLVLEAFVGPRPRNCDACHGMRGKGDNSLANLYWGTRQQNHYDDMIRDGTLVRGEKHGQARLKEKQVVRIKQRLREGARTCDLAREYNVGETTIYNIKAGNSWAWLENKNVLSLLSPESGAKEGKA